MRNHLEFYIDGQWVLPVAAATIDVENPATESVVGRIASGTAEDVDRAVKAARKAFPGWAKSTVAERLDLLEAIKAQYQKRYADLAAAIIEEMGSPAALAQGSQAGLGMAHLNSTIDALKTFRFEEQRGTTLIRFEPIGVCGLITPWNWPLNQIAVKVFPAIATGCTMLLKPSEVSHLSAHVFTEILEEAGVPEGVYNLVQGNGPEVGAAISGHPDIDMVSFTGSTRVGIEIARNAANSVKRVTQELGGKSAHILLDDEGLPDAAARGVGAMMLNSGQSCNAGTRMLVPASRSGEAIEAARKAAEAITVGDPNGDFTLGPVVSRVQFDRIQACIRKGIEEGATLVSGGEGRPEGLEKGYYVKPTVFAHVTNDMTIAREEIFGPVLVMLEYGSIEEAVAIANDSEYGLAGYVTGMDRKLCQEIAKDLRAGLVSVNGGFDITAPFGGYKHSGNGREWGDYGFHDYLEIKSIPGYLSA